MLTTQKQVRAQFWEEYAEWTGQPIPRGWRSKRQNDHNATVRDEWVNFVDNAARNGVISERLAQRITL